MTMPPVLAVSTTPDTLVRLSTALRASLSADIYGDLDSILDELDEVLDPHTDLTDQQVADRSGSLHSTLRAMLHLATPSPGHFHLTRALLLEQRPASDADALGYTRRLAIAVLDLADEAVKSPAPP
ncbi:hypothetical protein [Actinacidiphila sp. bgisy145]|uniref:hypothetical protein n=1 Tax=Actinacidiphila sp. bgisy145 TaxID=3413792 RepID=UPI003EB8612F